jgi:hypothetical protein
MGRQTNYILEEITEDLRGKKAYIRRNRTIRKMGKDKGFLRLYPGLAGTEGTLIFIPKEESVKNQPMEQSVGSSEGVDKGTSGPVPIGSLK